MKQGTMVTVYLVPVHEGRMVTFDVRAREAQGRWLPWSVLEFAGNPSFNPPGGGWELAIVFRAELTALPRPREDRTPAVFDPGRFDAIGPFDPVDLQRWVEWRAPAGKALATPRKGGELLF
ncbi:hypothetical protein EDM76_05445 [bacterium]|nr:MAG: hypothetical protein EDM76_05445 [bacterium]